MVKGAVASRIRTIEVSPLLGHALAAAITEDRHVPLLEAAIRWAARALDANEELIREMVHKRANWVLQLAGLDEKLADAIIDGLRKLTVDMCDRSRPSRAGQGRGGARASSPTTCRRDPRLRARVEAMKERDARQQVGRPLARRAVGEDPRRRAPRRAQPRRGVGRASSAKCCVDRRDAAEGPAHPARRSTSSPAAPSSAWSAQLWQPDRQAGLARRSAAGTRGTVTDRLEGAVGRDLQYIRINGTLVGGLVGLVLHALDTL